MLSAVASIRGEGTITLARLCRTIVLICCSLVATTALRAQAVPPDLLLLDADPLADVRAAGRPFAVVAGGRFHDRAALDAMLEAAAAPDLERTQRNVVEGLLAQGSDVSALQP